MAYPLVAALALVFALAHALFLPSSLEDIDSVNFALGLRDFDVAQHRPHPPGYPVYIGLGKVTAAMVEPLSPGRPRSFVDARSLALMSLAAGSAAIFLLYRLFACFRPSGVSRTGQPWHTFDPVALAATALAASCPLFWYMAVRPMSDLPGLTAALASQLCLALAWWRQTPTGPGDRRLPNQLLTASGRMIVLGALLAGAAAGVRSQTLWLTVPLLGLVLVDRIGRGVAGALLGSSVAFGVGAAAWIVPLVVASGGLDAYLAALGSQAGEDFASGEMLYLNPAARVLGFALLQTFAYGWDSLALAGVVLVLAAAGGLWLLVRDRRTAAAVAALTLPYATFHLMFQDTSFVRYSLPLVPATAFLAAIGIRLLGTRAVLPVAGLLTIWALVIASPTLAGYSARPSPTTRVVEAMRMAVPAAPGALGLHQTFRRPLQAEDLPPVTQLPSPPRREMAELARYWREGGTEMMWFLADPRRTDLVLIDPASRTDRVVFRWDVDSLSNIGGIRPTSVWWYRIPPPGWFAEDGWALTPETAGMSRLAGQGPHLGPIHAWVRRRHAPLTMLIGGRHLGGTSDASARFTVTIDEQRVATWDVAPGSFLNVWRLEPEALAGTGPLARLSVASSAKAEGGVVVPTAIEQFDMQPAGTLMWAFDAGWHEAEYEPARGVWHWTAERAHLRVVDAAPVVELSLRIESPRRYFDRPSNVQLRAGARLLRSMSVLQDQDVSLQIARDALDESGGTVTIETDQTFVPAERDNVSDRRRLGLRIFDVTIRPSTVSPH